jgi:hypothetical protein
MISCERGNEMDILYVFIYIICCTVVILVYFGSIYIMSNRLKKLEDWKEQVMNGVFGKRNTPVSSQKTYSFIEYIKKQLLKKP